MASMKALPPSLKPLERYMKCASQLDKFEPAVAYFCRQFAIEMGIQLRGKNQDPDSKAYLLALMDKLEKDKQKVDSIGIQSKEEYMINFTLKVLKAADDEYKIGAANKNTARSFLHASIFFDVLKQFNALSPEFQRMQKYAKWKATEIANAIREGRQPLPGAGEEELDLNMGDSSSMMVDPSVSEPLAPADSQPDVGDLFPSVPTATYSTPPPQGPISSLPIVPRTQKDIPAPSPAPTQPSPQYPVANRTPPQPQRHETPPVQHQPQAPVAPQQTYQPPAPAVPPQAFQQPAQVPQAWANPPPPQVIYVTQPQTYQPQMPPGAYAPTDQQQMEAQKYAKYAVSALQFDDLAAAIKNLKLSLKLLTGE